MIEMREISKQRGHKRPRGLNLDDSSDDMLNFLVALLNGKWRILSHLRLCTNFFVE